MSFTWRKKMDAKTNNAISKSMMFFHWVIGLGMIAVLISGLVMDDESNNLLFNAHMSFGLLVLALSVPRLVGRLIAGMPKPMTERSKFASIVAAVVMYSLLALTVVLPLSGIAVSVGEGYGLSLFGFELVSSGREIHMLKELGEGIHEFSGEALLPFLLVLHLGASFMHHFIKQDGTLLRMLGKA
ncbi:TPA: cytochrome b [Vibrio parahaemolyticus]|nr:cytochrome b [Vibrio parahaemolyticus]TOB19757.1 cytochrome B [Vibrio parahaemolyticus]HBN6201727.1 cytochrome b [Vibrio parahaemolyticus]HBN6206396.1 cytochrome b [Vibrio parahaemolyticus]HCG9580869.1 cytochrome b [Vibrio parahaemolyticus]